jgi:hypothetical protein
MPRPRLSQFAWSADDEAAFIKWRRGVCIVYVCVGLTLVAALGLNRLAGDRHKDAVLDAVLDAASLARAPSAPSAGIIPPAARR